MIDKSETPRTDADDLFKRTAVPGTFRMNAMTLPDCQMPDGAEPCKGYVELYRKCSASGNERDKAEARADRLAEALYKLMNEAAACAEMSRPCIGHTNTAILLERIEQARAALASAPTNPGLVPEPAKNTDQDLTTAAWMGTKIIQQREPCENGVHLVNNDGVCVTCGAKPEQFTGNCCPTCGSTNPAWHPALQADGGEVHLCRDPWHRPTADEIEAREGHIR